MFLVRVCVCVGGETLNVIFTSILHSSKKKKSSGKKKKLRSLDALMKYTT